MNKLKIWRLDYVGFVVWGCLLYHIYSSSKQSGRRCTAGQTAAVFRCWFATATAVVGSVGTARAPRVLLDICTPYYCCTTHDILLYMK